MQFPAGVPPIISVPPQCDDDPQSIPLELFQLRTESETLLIPTQLLRGLRVAGGDIECIIEDESFPTSEHRHDCDCSCECEDERGCDYRGYCSCQCTCGSNCTCPHIIVSSIQYGPLVPNPEDPRQTFSLDLEVRAWIRIPGTGIRAYHSHSVGGVAVTDLRDPYITGWFEQCLRSVREDFARIGVVVEEIQYDVAKLGANRATRSAPFV